MEIKNRKFYNMAIPATLAADTEIFSSVYHTDSQTGGTAFVSVPDVSKLGSSTTNNMSLTPYTSYDGTTWLTGTAVTIARSGTPGAATTSLIVENAPYFKVGFKTAATGGLQSGHAIVVTVGTIESEQNFKRVSGYREYTEGAITATIDLTGKNKYISRTVVSLASTATVITDFDYEIYTSFDGEVWYKVASRSNMVNADMPDTDTYDDVQYGKYVRFKVAALASGTSGAKVRVLFTAF